MENISKSMSCPLEKKKQKQNIFEYFTAFFHM